MGQMSEFEEHIYTKEEFLAYGNRLHFNTVIDITVNSFAAYIVLKHSTKAMGAYKYYILLTIFCAFLMDFHISFIFGPFLMLPTTILCGSGFIARHLGVFWGQYFQFGFMHVTVSSVGMSLIYCLFYQYSSLNENLTFFHSIKGIIFIFLSIIFYGLPPYLIIACTMNYEEMKEFVKLNFQNSYELYSAVTPCSAMILDYKSKIYFGFLVLLFINVWVIMSILAFKIHQKLAAMKNMLSAATLKARKQLLVALCFQMTIPFMLIIFPFVLILISIIIGAKQINTISGLAFPIIALHSLVNACSIMFIITPYRKAVINICKKLFRIKKNPSVTVIKNHTTILPTASNKFLSAK